MGTNFTCFDREKSGEKKSKLEEKIIFSSTGSKLEERKKRNGDK